MTVGYNFLTSPTLNRMYCLLLISPTIFSHVKNICKTRKVYFDIFQIEERVKQCQCSLVLPAGLYLQIAKHKGLITRQTGIGKRAVF